MLVPSLNVSLAASKSSFIQITCATIAFALFACVASAQDDSSPVNVEVDCYAISESEFVKIAYCKPNLIQENVIKGAISICKGEPECLVWIWDDLENAPDVAPANSQDLKPEEIQTALGVWDNTSRQMITISEN